MSTNYRLERRRDRVAEREQDRADRLAEREMAGRERRDAQARARRDKAAHVARVTDRRAARAARRSARITAARGWLGAHVVDLLIYPLAVASAVMAVPAMAAYGRQVYGGATGVVLPVLSELGMWAFALATMAARREQRASWGLSAGVVVFAAIGAALNLAHGLQVGGLVHGVVMAVVSVAGVVAHQLVVAAPRRTSAERRERRVSQLAQARVGRARRLATRSAVIELDPSGGAELVYAPGRYTPARRVLRTRLVPAIVPALPVAPVDEWDAALAELADPAADAVLAEPLIEVDPPASITEPDQGGSTTESGSIAIAEPGRSKRRRIDPQARRRLSPTEALEMARRVARAHGAPVSAEQIRRALRIAPASARTLRDQVNHELYGTGDES